MNLDGSMVSYSFNVSMDGYWDLFLNNIRVGHRHWDLLHNVERYWYGYFHLDWFWDVDMNRNGNGNRDGLIDLDGHVLVHFDFVRNVNVHWIGPVNGHVYWSWHLNMKIMTK